MAYWLLRASGAVLIVIGGLVAISGSVPASVGFLAGVVLFCASEVIDAKRTTPK